MALGLLLLFSCDNEEEMGSIQFCISNAGDIPIQKSANVNQTVVPIQDIPCSDLRPEYVEITIDGSVYTAETFYIIGADGYESLYTETFPIRPGNHEVQDFKVYSTNSDGDPVLISATPHEGSSFEQYVTSPLNFDVTIVSDQKLPFAIDVVCYDANYAVDFGFAYTGVSTIEVHSYNFFGDFVIKNKTDYESSLYATQTNWDAIQGVYYDAPAISRIELWHKRDNGEWVLEQTEENSSEGETIEKIQYDDHGQVLDSIELKFFVYVKLGRDYNYKYFFSIFLKDDERPNETTDPNNSDAKTTYYVIGTSHQNPDYQLPGYMVLPETATYKIVGDHAPGSMGGYVDAELSNIEPYYEISNGTYDAYCASHLVNISIGVEYSMNVYSSLYLDEIPACAKSEQWAKLNWLINHIGLPGSENLYGNFSWSDFQGAVWLLEDTPWNGFALDGVPDVNSTMEQMVQDASANYIGYNIPPGGWACVIFIPTNTPMDAIVPTIQTTFIRVDP